MYSRRKKFTPYKKRTAATSGYRRYRRRRTTLRTRVATSSRGLNVRPYTRAVMPARMSTKLVYSQILARSISSGPSFTLFSLNGLNDPWLEDGGAPSAGHQPRGFDQLSSIWNDYVVTGCKVIIEGSCSTAGGYLLGVGAYAKGAVIPTDSETINELSQYSTLVVSSQRPFKFSRYYDVAKVLGTTRSNLLDESDYHGLSTGTANPNYGAGLHIYVKNLDPTQSNIHQMTVQLVYYVTYFNKKPLPFS